MSIHQMTSAELPRTQPLPRLRETDNPIQREIDAELAARLDREPTIDHELQDPTPLFWLPVSVAIVMMIGLAYMFFSPPSGADLNTRAASATTHSEPSPH